MVEGCRAIGFTLGVPDRQHARGGRGHPRGPGLRRRTGPRPPRSWPSSPTCIPPRRTTSPTPWPRPPWPGRTGVPAGRGPRRPARVRARRPPDRRRRRRSPGCGTWTTRRRPTATPPQTSLLAYDRVVWIAGGMAKGQQFDELVRGDRRPAGGRSCCSGVDRALIADALARHAPDVPVVEVARTDTGAMERWWRRRGRAGRARGHGAAGARLRVVGHVPRLRPARRPVRRGGRRAGAGGRVTPDPVRPDGSTAAAATRRTADAADLAGAGAPAS